MSHGLQLLKEGKITCPKGDDCPNVNNSLSCPAYFEDGDGCPFLAEGHMPSSNAFTPGEVEQAVRIGMRKAVRSVVTEIVARTVREMTPGTDEHLHYRLEQQESSRHRQRSIAALFKLERAEWTKLLDADGKPVRMGYRPELDGYLGPRNSQWPENAPILSLAFA